MFSSWNEAELNGYLVEITADIFRKVDKVTGKRLVDVVLDAAHQLGTGMWTSQDAFALHVPTPTIDTAVMMRNLSGSQDLRAAINQEFGEKIQALPSEQYKVIPQARRAFYTSIILTYAQGFTQLEAASQAYRYDLDLSAVARIWRGGCIIRSKLLEPIRDAFELQPQLTHLLMDKTLGEAVLAGLDDLRGLVQTASSLNVPAPAFMATLSYIDSLRSLHLPANLIQAQRDYFGAHTYERVDERGVFHTQWSKE